MSRLVTLAALALALALALATPARALFHLAEISEAMSGIAGDPTIQFVEIRMLGISQNFPAHSRLTSFSCDGTSVNVLLEVPGNLANAGTDVRWIMGSSTSGAFLGAFGITPDFTFPGGIDPTCGNLCWGAPGLLPPNPPTWDPSDPNNYVSCLEYGGYTGPHKTTGNAVVAGPLGNGVQSQTKANTVFGLACPTPENNAGAVGSLASCTTTTTSTTTSTTLPPGPGTPIDGTKLTLKDDPTNALKRKATVVSKDPDLSLGGGNGSPDDPRTAAEPPTVRIVSAAGDGFDDTYTLPQSGWTLIGHEGENKGYKYKDSLLLNGPVKVAVLKPAKQLKISAKGSALGHTLGSNPSPVDVVVTIGGLTYCQHYGGTVTYRTPKTYSAKLAPAGACPP